jgi:hypothetical protein
MAIRQDLFASAAMKNGGRGASDSGDDSGFVSAAAQCQWRVITN